MKKNMEIIELEIGCYQLEAIDLLEAHIMLFTSKLSAGVHQLKASQAMPPKGKPPPQRGKGGKNGGKKSLGSRIHTLRGVRRYLYNQ